LFADPKSVRSILTNLNPNLAPARLTTLPYLTTDVNSSITLIVFIIDAIVAVM